MLSQVGPAGKGAGRRRQMFIPAARLCQGPLSARRSTCGSQSLSRGCRGSLMTPAQSLPLYNHPATCFFTVSPLLTFACPCAPPATPPSRRGALMFRCGFRVSSDLMLASCFRVVALSFPPPFLPLCRISSRCWTWTPRMLKPKPHYRWRA